MKTSWSITVSQIKERSTQATGPCDMQCVFGEWSCPGRKTLCYNLCNPCCGSQVLETSKLASTQV